MPASFFKDLPLFATHFLDKSTEFSQFPINDIKKISNKEDIIKIAFFDIWMGNEDRSWNNFNLLINPSNSGLKIVPIDHGACLNSLSFLKERKLVTICENESLIETELFKELVKPKLKNLKAVNDFVNSLYICIPQLEKIYDDEVLKLPKKWNIPEPYIKVLKANLFHPDWLNETKTHFLSLIKVSLKLK